MIVKLIFQPIFELIFGLIFGLNFQPIYGLSFGLFFEPIFGSIFGSTLTPLPEKIATTNPVALVKQSSLSSFFDPVNKKRAKPDIADDDDDPADAVDPLRLLLTMMEKNHAEITKKMDTNHNDVTSKICEIGSNFEVLESTVAKATSDISAKWKTLIKTSPIPIWSSTVLKQTWLTRAKMI